MNKTWLRSLTISLAALTVLGVSSAPAQLGPISIKVTVEGDKDQKGQSLIQGKRLLIDLANRSFKDYTNLTVKYFFFDKDLKTKELEIAKAGENQLDMPRNNTQQIKTDRVALEQILPHMERQHGSYQTISVPATGKKHMGYGVQVFHEEKVISKLFDPSDLEKDFAKMPPPDANAPDKEPAGKKPAKDAGKKK